MKVWMSASSLVLIVIGFWFLGRGLWPHEFSMRQTGEGVVLLSASVFATAGLLRMINALLGEGAWGLELEYLARQYGQALFPEELLRGLMSGVIVTMVGTASGLGVAWICKVCPVPPEALPTRSAELIAWAGHLTFDLYALVLAWWFATSVPAVIIALGRTCVRVAIALLGRLSGDRLTVIRIIHASRTLKWNRSHSQRDAAIGILSAIPGPAAERKLIEVLEREDEVRVHAKVAAMLRQRGWSPSTPLQWKRVALNAPSDDPACIQVLVDLLRDRDPNKRQHAARVLDSIGWSPAAPEELFAFVLANGDDVTDYMSIASEGEVAIDFLVEILEDQFPGKSWKAREALLSIPSDRVTRTFLERVAADKTDREYKSLLQLCCGCSYPHTADLLMKLLAADPSTTNVRSCVAEVLRNQKRDSLHFLTPNLTQAVLAASSIHQALRWSQLLIVADLEGWERFARKPESFSVMHSMFLDECERGNVDEMLSHALIAQCRQHALYIRVVGESLSKAILEERRPEVVERLRAVLTSVDQTAWNNVWREARRRRRPWTAPSQDEMKKFGKELVTFISGRRDQDRIRAGEAIQEFLKKYVEWVGARELKKIARLTLRLEHTYHITHYEKNDDGCDVPSGGSQSTAVFDSAPLKQLARQELIRRGESA